MAVKTAARQKRSVRVPRSSISKAGGYPSARGMNARPVGQTGLQRTGGYVYEEFLKDLQGVEGIRIYKEMRDNDPIIGATFFAIEMFLRRVKWYVDPPEDDPEGEEKAQFVRECKDDMSHTFADFISEVMSMMQYGWSWHEVLYKIRSTKVNKKTETAKSKFNDGKYGWRKFETRSQDSFSKWEFDEEGGIAGLWQRPAPTYEEYFIPIQKSLHFRTQSRKNNPEGRSVLRNAYRPWYFKKRIEEIEGIGIERDLAGLPFAEVPAEMLREDASDDDKATVAAIIELVKNVRRDQQEGVVWPQVYDKNGNPLYKFSLMNAGGTRQFSTDQIITRYEQRMAMVVLADFILLGNDSTGSFAMSTSKTGMFQAALSAWLDSIQDVLNQYAIPRLFELNKWEGPYPTFRHDEVQKPSLADLSVLVAALAGAGAQLFPDAELENHFREIAQFPQRAPRDEDHKESEEDLREAKMEAELEGAKQATKLAKQPAPTPMQQFQATQQQAQQAHELQRQVVSGKQPGTKPGAPTKTTGRVKSKLPPASRRNTKATAAAANVKKVRTVKISKRVLENVR